MRVFSHFQIIKDDTNVKGKLTHFLSNVTRALGLDQTDGEATQAGHVFRAVAGADSTTVFIISPIKDVVAAVFYTPVAAVYGKETLSVSLLGWTTGDAIHDFSTGFSGFLFGNLTLDSEGLGDMGELQVGVKRCSGPNFSHLDAAMIRGVAGNQVWCSALFKIELYVFK